MIRRLHSAQHGRGGQALVFVLLTVVTLIAFIALTVNLSELLARKIHMQSAADAAALSGAVWQARCLNLVAALNIGITACMAGITAMIIAIAISRGALIPSLGPKIAKLYRAVRKMARVQDVIIRIAPILVEAEVYRISRLNEAMGALAFKPALPPWPRLHIHRLGVRSFDPSRSWKKDEKTVSYHGHSAVSDTTIPLPCIRDDDFDAQQYVFSVAVRAQEPVLMRARELFGYENPRLLDLPPVKIGAYELSGPVGMITTAQAAPFNDRERAPLLMVPQWKARLVPVTVLQDIPVSGLGKIGGLLADGLVHH